MEEYATKVKENLPSPTTIRQQMVDAMVRDVLSDLQSFGEARLCYGRYDGNKNLLLATGRRVVKIFKDKGYEATIETYAESNKNKFFDLKIKVPV